jgi:type IV pilus assembly protein PilM
LKIKLFKRPTLIGLDIQSDGIRLVQLTKHRRQLCVELAVLHPLPDDVFTQSKLVQWDVLTAALAELVVELGLNGLPAAIGLPAHAIRKQRIQLPLGLTEKEIEFEVIAHIQKDFPGMKEALCVDFSTLPCLNPGYMDIVFVAVKQAYLSHYVASMNAAGLKVKIADIDMYALMRAVRFTEAHSSFSNASNAVLTMTNNEALLIGYDQQDILFHQHWNIDKTNEFKLTNPIKTLAVCCSDKKKQACLQAISESWGSAYYYPNPFAHMKVNQVVNASWLAANSGELMLACGLAMREVPVWLC